MWRFWFNLMMAVYFPTIILGVPIHVAVLLRQHDYVPAVILGSISLFNILVVARDVRFFTNFYRGVGYDVAQFFSVDDL